jgi:hypothetical protein
VGDFEIPPDVSAWLAVWEASMKDPNDDGLAAFAGELLLGILADRGLSPREVQRQDRLRE